MKDTSNLIMVNREQYHNWLNGRMAKNYSFVYTKGKLEGYDLTINMSCKCIDDNSEFHFIWQEESLADTDGCSFGDLNNL